MLNRRTSLFKIAKTGFSGLKGQSSEILIPFFDIPIGPGLNKNRF
jgi:hypothetical protein